MLHGEAVSLGMSNTYVPVLKTSIARAAVILKNEDHLLGWTMNFFLVDEYFTCTWLQKVTDAFEEGCFPAT